MNRNESNYSTQSKETEGIEEYKSSKKTETDQQFQMSRTTTIEKKKPSIIQQETEYLQSQTQALIVSRDHSRNASKTNRVGESKSIVDKLRVFKEEMDEMFPCKQNLKSLFKINENLEVSEKD